MERGFPPIIDENTRVLILGSFPGGESLRLQQYYGNPRNQFWRLVGDSIGVELVTLPYEQRLNALRDNSVGVWDVIDACVRKGSLDSSIKDEQGNDLGCLQSLAPGLKLVCFNGKKAASYEDEIKRLGYRTIVLPSSSPAHQTKNYEQKLLEWKAAIKSAFV